jgi:hypothetical protein
MPVSLTKPLISAYEDAGRWACSHFDNKFEMLKQRTGSKETSWQLVTAYKSDYREVYITQCSSEGLVDILAWINVFLMGKIHTSETQNHIFFAIMGGYMIHLISTRRPHDKTKIFPNLVNY